MNATKKFFNVKISCCWTFLNYIKGLFSSLKIVFFFFWIVFFFWLKKKLGEQSETHQGIAESKKEGALLALPPFKLTIGHSRMPHQ